MNYNSYVIIKIYFSFKINIIFFVIKKMSQIQSLSNLSPEYDYQLYSECNKCYEKPQCNSNWGWLGALILWFIIFTVLFWLIYYSLKPSFVLQNDSNQVDTAKVLLAAVISALILVIIIWLIKAALTLN